MSDPGKNVVCKYCQLTFSTDVDFDLHACLEIKLETHNCDQDLSEEFLSTIIQYVDDLCNIITNGDPNLERTTEVNQNLNEAVNCYRNKLCILESIDQKDHLDILDQDMKTELVDDDSENRHEITVETNTEEYGGFENKSDNE